MQHIFPPKVTEHRVALNNGERVTLLVSPSETYGHALARAGIAANSIASVELPDSPIWYEPDHAIATR